MSFDFEAAVSSPFRMQPGLRRIAAGVPQFTPLQPGSRHQREKLAVLSAYWTQALCAVPGFDAAPAIDAWLRHAAAEHPGHWRWDGGRAHAVELGVAVRHDTGAVEQVAAGRFGCGDEVARCVGALPAAWRAVALASLTFAEDCVVVDAPSGTIPWLAVTLPSHWAPESRVGQHFAQIHADVADNALLLGAGNALLRLVTAAAHDDRWERFVWNITDHPRLHAHPARVGPRWDPPVADTVWLRTERQTFIAVPGGGQAVFTIGVDVRPLAAAVDTPARAQALRAALATMSPAVLAYRHLDAVREPLLAWLDRRARLG